MILETLTRIGEPAPDTNTLFQNFFILHKRGQYYILHYKELQRLDGDDVDLSEKELSQRNAVVQLLEAWNMVDIADPQQIADPPPSMLGLRIIKFQDKNNWRLIPRYRIGRK